MTIPQVRRFSGFLLFSTLALLPSDGRAGTLPYWGLSFGTSERAAASLGVTFGDRVPGSVGVAKRLEEKSRGANVLFTWGIGAQVRIGGSKSR